MIIDSILWGDHAEIFSFGKLALRWYGLLFAGGFYFGYLIVKKFLKLEKLPLTHLDSLTMYMILGGLLGARFGHCLFYEPEYYLQHPFDIIKPWSGRIGENAVMGIQGLASHGGALGILISIWIFCYKHKMSYLWVLDRVAVVTALAGSMIRLGNLMNSEIIGMPSNVPWAFIFERLKDNTPRHPAQLYESIVYLLIFIALYIYYTKNIGKIKGGELLGSFCVLVFSMRFFIEFIKEDQVGFESGMALNMGQILSIPFVIFGILLIINAIRTKDENKAQAYLKVKSKK